MQWMEGQKYFGDTLPEEPAPKDDVAVLTAAKKWLERYSAGKRPGIDELTLAPVGSAFRQSVWRIIPCHRVVGTGGSLTGYAGGIENKLGLLELEGADISGLAVPLKESAL